MAKTKTRSTGDCEFCGRTFPKQSMTRHLAACPDRTEAIERLGKGKRPHSILLLAVEGRHQPDYWLHLELGAATRFSDLDAFLRHIWLECCGHCSEFRFPRPKRFSGGGPGGVPRDFMAMMAGLVDGADPFDEAQSLMEESIGSRLNKGDVVFHEYDFGSTTELKVKVVGQRQGTLQKGRVSLLARNRPPEILCDCGKPAAWVCTECVWDGDGWLCRKCGERHGCGEEMLLPVVNSPRVGVCGYTG